MVLIKALLWPVNSFSLIEFTKAFSERILYWQILCFFLVYVKVLSSHIVYWLMQSYFVF